ncbi:MAG: hypothetical protein V3W51_04250 [Candidatus Brocadiales bacterium]
MKRSKYNPVQQQLIAEKILSISQQVYDKVKMDRPDEDEHFYLATAWLRRFFRDKRPYLLGDRLSDEELDRLSWTETMQFSILDPPDSMRALGLYMIYKECPREYLKYVREYNKLMEPVTEARENETFMDIYRQKNPRIVMRSEEQ